MSINVLPLFTDETNSCLTNHDLLLAGVDAISLNLKNLLIRPGMQFLIKNNLIRKYYAWDKKLILNCKSLNFNDKNELLIRSEIDGSKFVFSKDEIWQLIDALDVDKVIHEDADPEYLVGSFDLNFVLKHANLKNLYIENHKHLADGYIGVFYRDMQEYKILEDKWEFEFTVLDKKCGCYTCSNDFTCGYLHHLLKNTPLLAQRLLMLHNVFYINHLP